MNVEIRLLGPVTLYANGQHDPLGSAKERLLLAALAVDAGRPVTADGLIRRLWGDRPPAKPRASLHVYLTRLRNRLATAADAGPEGGGAPRLEHPTRAYLLEAAGDTVDWLRFRRLADEARQAADRGADQQALTLFRSADELWRGDPLIGVGSSEWAASTRLRLEDRRLTATLARIAVELRMGHFTDLASELAELSENHPLDESVAADLMVATHGCGRQAEALRVFERTRRRLREDSGADPGALLTRLHGLVLDGAPTDALLAETGARPRTSGAARPGAPAPDAPRTAPAPSAPVPDNLPSHGPLIGRTAELDHLLGPPDETAPGPSDTSGSAPPPRAISGMPGTGKSLLALHAARILGARYGEGQLFVDLRAHSAGRSPLTPQAALTTLLRTLGVPAENIPQDLDDLTALWRATLGSRRVVVILDDVVDIEQIRPLLAARSAARVLITSRRRLAGLPEMRTVSLDILPAPDAAELFTSLVGAERTPHRGEVDEIVRLCGSLPLAITLAAGRLNSRPTWSTAHLARRLAGSRSRLTELHDGNREIARPFTLSYASLSHDEQRAFRFLALRFATQFDLPAAAALFGVRDSVAERTLEALLDAHFIQEPSAERYGLHSLLDEFSAALLQAEDSEPAQSLARQRLADHYARTVPVADRLLYPNRPRPFQPAHLDAPDGGFFGDDATARAWLTAEHASVVAATRLLYDRGDAESAARTTFAVAHFLNADTHASDARELLVPAVEHWQETGALRAEMLALVELGSALLHMADYDEAESAVSRALRLARNVGDAAVEAEALTRLGNLYWEMGRFNDALTKHEEALTIGKRENDSWRIARSNLNAGTILLFLGNHRRGRQALLSALSAFRRVQDPRGTCFVLNNLADLSIRTGDKRSARARLHEALAIAQTAGTKQVEAGIKVTLADTYDISRDAQKALTLYRESASTLGDLGDHKNQSIALIGAGFALAATDRLHEAVETGTLALQLARSVRAEHEVAQALRLLGEAEAALGATRSATAHLRECIDLGRRISAPREEAYALEVQASLAERSGDKTEAGKLLHDALAIFASPDFNAPVDAARVRRHLEELTGGENAHTA